MMGRARMAVVKPLDPWQPCDEIRAVIASW